MVITKYVVCVGSQAARLACAFDCKWKVESLNVENAIYLLRVVAVYETNKQMCPKFKLFSADWTDFKLPKFETWSSRNM